MLLMCICLQMNCKKAGCCLQQLKIQKHKKDAASGPSWSCKNHHLPPSSVLTIVFGVVTFSSAYPAETVLTSGALRQIIICREFFIQWQDLVTNACYTHAVFAVELRNGVITKVQPNLWKFWSCSMISSLAAKNMVRKKGNSASILKM